MLNKQHDIELKKLIWRHLAPRRHVEQIRRAEAWNTTSDLEEVLKSTVMQIQIPVNPHNFAGSRSKTGPNPDTAPTYKLFSVFVKIMIKQCFKSSFAVI